MDDRTIPKQEQSYAYCPEGSTDLCKGFAAQRQGRMLTSHQHRGFGPKPIPPPEPQPSAEPVRAKQKLTERFTIGLTHLHSSSDHMVWDAVIIEPVANAEDKHGRPK